MDGNFKWYRLFNRPEFIAAGLVSFEGTFYDENLQLKNFVVFQGEYTSVLFDDTLLSINLNDKNPFRFGDYAVFLDGNSDVWLGIYAAN